VSQVSADDHVIGAAAGKAQLLRERDRWSQLVDAIGRVMNPAQANKG